MHGLADDDPERAALRERAVYVRGAGGVQERTVLVCASAGARVAGQHELELLVLSMAASAS